jgi:hypothetical protein
MYAHKNVRKIPKIYLFIHSISGELGRLVYIKVLGVAGYITTCSLPNSTPATNDVRKGLTERKEEERSQR